VEQRNKEKRKIKIKIEKNGANAAPLITLLRLFVQLGLGFQTTILHVRLPEH
jgi:hypothetical protein